MIREWRVISQPLTGRWGVAYFVDGTALYVLETFATEEEADNAAAEYNAV